MKLPLICLLLLLFTAGCATTPGTRHQLTVGNGHPELPLKNVRVEAEDRPAREFSRIAPSKLAAMQPRRGPPPRSISVQWTAPDGTQHSQTVQTDDIPTEFRGQLALEITQDNQLTLSRVDPVEGERSILPWNTPEAWEGSIMLPGMNER